MIVLRQYLENLRRLIGKQILFIQNNNNLITKTKKKKNENFSKEIECNFFKIHFGILKNKNQETNILITELIQVTLFKL